MCACVRAQTGIAFKIVGARFGMLLLCVSNFGYIFKIWLVRLARLRVFKDGHNPGVYGRRRQHKPVAYATGLCTHMSIHKLYTLLYTCLRTHPCMRLCNCLRTCLCTRLCTCITHLCAFTSQFICQYISLCARVYAHAYTHVNTRLDASRAFCPPYPPL